MIEQEISLNIPIRAQDWDDLPTWPEFRAMQDELNRRQTVTWLRALIARHNSMRAAAASAKLDRAHFYRVAKRAGITITSNKGEAKIRRMKSRANKLAQMTAEQRADYDTLRRAGGYKADEAWRIVMGEDDQ